MIPTMDPFVLFLRHAERVAIPHDDPYRDVDLTPAGQASVASLADALSGRLRWTAASPFTRCRATARGLGPEPEDDTRLGMHGPWVTDPEAAGRQFALLGTEGVVRAQINGVALPGVRRLEDGVRVLLSAGFERIHRGSGVCVTHDAVLMPAMAWLFGREAVDAWLAPLGGFVVERRGSGFVAVHDGRECPC